MICKRNLAVFHKIPPAAIDKTAYLCDNGENFPRRKNMKRLISLVLAVVCVIGLLASCNGVVADVADNVLTAAKDELMTQIKDKVEQYKVIVKEAKAAVGTLNDEGGKYQFYSAILIQTNEESSAADCAVLIVLSITLPPFLLLKGTILHYVIL